MNFLQAINSDTRVLIVCNKTGGTIEGEIKKIKNYDNLTDLYSRIDHISESRSLIV